MRQQSNSVLPRRARRRSASAAAALAAMVALAGCSDVAPLNDAYGSNGGPVDGGGITPEDDTGGTLPPADTVAPDVADAPDAVEIDTPDSGSEPDVLPDVAPPVDIVTPDTSLDTQDTGSGCPQVPGTPPLAERACALRFEVALPQGTSSVTVRSELNGWGDPADWPLEDTDGDGVWTGEVDTSGMTPGAYGYKLFLNGETWDFDPSTPLRTTVGGEQNSKLYVSDCTVPEMTVESLSVDPTGSIDAVVAVADGAGSPGLLPETARASVAGVPLDDCTYDEASQRFNVSLSGLDKGKHTLRFAVANAAGEAEPLYVPVWIEDAPFSWARSVMYFAFVDRFANGEPANDIATPCIDSDDPANWKGGDWKGLREKIESGWFDALGVNALWITAPADNPDGCVSGDLAGKTYTAYHGYFPISLTEPESRFGTMDDLRAAVDAAHARGIRVLVDLVANHTHDQHPAYGAHPDWFYPYFQCGFEEAPIECWFQPYLPDIDYTKDDAVEAFSDMALFWIREADIDGLRVDAVKHVHTNFLLTLRWKLDRLTAASGETLYTVGETFVGDWGGGGGGNEGTIKKYVGSQLLHGQFDFPLYWKVVRGFARGEEPLSSLGQFLVDSAGYYGPGSVMATFLGNHDVPRFLSHASGAISDVWGNGSKEQGYDNPPGAPADAAPYERLRAAYSFLFSVTGIPLIYYGDEIGLPGAGDPDNRRMMQFDGLSPEQQATIAHIGALAGIRADHPALSDGATTVLSSGDSTLALLRTLGTDRVIAVFNRADSPETVTVSTDLGPALTDALSGKAYTVTGGQLSVDLPPRSARILTP